MPGHALRGVGHGACSAYTTHCVQGWHQDQVSSAPLISHLLGFQTSVLSHAGCHASDEPPVSIPKEPKRSLKFSIASQARLLLCFSERTSCYWYCLVVSSSPHPSVSICCDLALLTSFLG